MAGKSLLTKAVVKSFSTNGKVSQELNREVLWLGLRINSEVVGEVPSAYSFAG
jgi:hypothetical protein